MRIIVIGSGPAGLWLAGSLKKHEVVLIEKNKALAKKLALTGNTRCNVTNSDNVNRFVERLIGEKKFAHNFIHSFNNQDIIKFFNATSCPLKQEENKFFPVSNKATDVIEVLKSRLTNVRVLLNTEVTDVLIENNQVIGVKLKDEIIKADAVVVATGGITYPATGSSGEGYSFFKGHEMEKLYPMECGLESLNPICKTLQGQSFNGVVKLNKKTYQGMFLMTHYGISGPIILELSQIISKDKISEITISFLNHVQDEKLIEHIKSHKKLNQALTKILSNNFVKKVFEPELLNMNTSEISKAKLKEICNQILHVKLNDIQARDFNVAFVTGGGLKLTDFTKYLESKKIKGLFALGEILNIHGPIGGYNISLCFSQAEHIARYLNDREEL